ncbi:MAG: HEAT repeat domain-containing protein [Asgard group archaeon]|nr:HEAT repeat domain-containing protein [Asgard group archaeon]
MDKYSREVMIALTSDNFENAVKQYLLNYDLENWKIFVDNYYKLTPFEAERILDVFEKNLDFHMIIDIISLAHIVGQSIALSSSLIYRFTKIDIEEYNDYLVNNITRLIQSSLAEERRIGLLLAGYFDNDEFFDEIEKLTNYDILFEDAYYALGLMSAPKVIELLGTKFMLMNKNHIQRKAIAKILANKGNPLAALWLYRSKDFDFTTPYTKAIYIARELAWSGIKPALLLTTDDDFLQPITLRFVDVLAVILSYDIELIAEIELEKTIATLYKALKDNPHIDVIKTVYALKQALNDIYYSIDPFNIRLEIRENIIKSWKMLQKFPTKNTLNYLQSYVEGTLNPSNDDFLYALRIIRNFRLEEFKTDVLEIARSTELSSEQNFEIISCLGILGGDDSLEFILETLDKNVNYKKRGSLNVKDLNFHSELDYIDDFNNELLVNINQSFEPSVLRWFNTDFNEIFYWNILYALGKTKSEKAIPIFIEALDDYDPKIRYQAINSLKQVGKLTEQIEEKLMTLARNDPFMSVQREAIIALGQLNSNSAIYFFINTIFSAIEEGILELANEIDYVYDNRWDYDGPDKSGQLTQDVKEMDKPAKNGEKSSSLDNKDLNHEFTRWIKKINTGVSTNLELREDLNDIDMEFTDEMDYYDSTDFGSVYDQSEFQPDNSEKQDEDDNIWLSELGEQFRKLTIVESAIEALKITNAKIPLNDIKELIEHPVDEELYKDILIILAKNRNTFALSELIGLFDTVDYIRAREIVNIFKRNNLEEINEFKSKINKSVDWLLKDKLKN